MEHVDTSICTDTDTPKVEIGPGKTYAVTCTAANGSSCYGEGTWSEYPVCIIETEEFLVCYNVTPTDEDILKHVDLNKECLGTPVINRGAGNTYNVTCTDANVCPCTGNGTWTVGPECGLETEPFSVCYGVLVTPEMILKHVHSTSCIDDPEVEKIDPYAKTYNVSCTVANGSKCYCEGYWTEYPECIIETEEFLVCYNVTPTDAQILEHLDLNKECVGTPIITKRAGNTYTIKCTDKNGCPCTGNGTWSEYPECIIETEPFSVPPGTNVTRDIILKHADTKSCVDTPQVDINPSARSFTIRCTDANGCLCTGNGTWTECPDCIIKTKPFSVCYNVTPTDAELLAQADLTACTGDPVLVRDDAAKTYTISCTDINNCPCSGEGTWSNYPECVIETTPLTICYGRTPTDDELLDQADLSACADKPVLVRDDAAKTYTISCTDINNCPCSGEGTWSNYPECVIETTPLTVCYGRTPTDDQLLAQADLSACADEPVLVRDDAAKTYTINCIDANDCPCNGEGYWTEVECGTRKTAWVFPGGNAVCFPGPEGGWGWYLDIPHGIMAPGEAYDFSGDIWTGAIRCDTRKGTDVGDAFITLTDSSIQVNLDLDPDYDALKIKAWAGNCVPRKDTRFVVKEGVPFILPKRLDLKQEVFIAVNCEV